MNGRRATRAPTGNSGGIVAPLPHPNIGKLGVNGAVGLSGQGRLAAEVKALRAGFAERPTAGDVAPARPSHSGSGGYRRQARSVRSAGRSARRWHARRKGASCRYRLVNRHDARNTQGREGGPARHRARTWRLRAGFPADRRRSRRKVEAMRLADHGIFRHADRAADHGRRVPFAPKHPEFSDQLVGPLHFVVPALVQPQYRVSLADQELNCGSLASRGKLWKT